MANAQIAFTYIEGEIWHTDSRRVCCLRLNQFQGLSQTPKIGFRIARRCATDPIGKHGLIYSFINPCDNITKGVIFKFVTKILSLRVSENRKPEIRRRRRLARIYMDISINRFEGQVG